MWHASSLPMDIMFNFSHLTMTKLGALRRMCPKLYRKPIGKLGLILSCATVFQSCDACKGPIFQNFICQDLLWSLSQRN
ncbi:hypothetical protein SEVIR_1G284133v4 [Setaria viridis]